MHQVTREAIPRPESRVTHWLTGRGCVGPKVAPEGQSLGSHAVNQLHLERSRPTSVLNAARARTRAGVAAGERRGQEPGVQQREDSCKL